MIQLFMAKFIPMVYKFNPSLEKRPMARLLARSHCSKRSQRLIEGRGDFMNNLLSEKSLYPPFAKGGDIIGQPISNNI